MTKEQLEMEITRIQREIEELFDERDEVKKRLKELMAREVEV